MKQTLLVVCTILFTVVAQGQQAIELRDGLVIDPQIDIAYVMSVDGGISAIDLKTGATRWHSKAAAKPLALVQKLLVSQVEPKSVDRTHILEMASLETRKGGAVSKAAINLEAPIRVSIGETLEGTFIAKAEPVDGSALITWDYVPNPREELQARPPSQKESDAKQRRRSGALRLNVATGKLTLMSESLPHQRQPAKGWVVSGEGIVPEEWRSFQSADGRYVLATRPIEGSTSWEYLWRVVDRDTRQSIGEFRSHLAFAPFVVRGSTVVFETTPYRHADQEPEPAKLRGISLQDGKQIWAVPIRETVRRSPPPP